jgi:hypothetical protein
MLAAGGAVAGFIYVARWRLTPADVSTVLYDMNFDWSAKNKARIVKKWKAEIER